MSDTPRGNPGAHCPECGKRLDDWTPVEGRSHPREGSVSGCLYCGAMLIFRADLTLRTPTATERREILAQMPGLEVFFERVTGAFETSRRAKKVKLEA